MKQRNAFAFGLAGFAGLLLFFFGVLSVANSPAHAIDQFKIDWYWILPLTLGFGIQIGLYVWLNNALVQSAFAQKEIAATASMSGGAMVACCAHHIFDILPLAGASIAAAFLTQYQPFFIAIGLVSNVIGIALLLRMAKKHGVLNTRVWFLEKTWMHMEKKS